MIREFSERFLGPFPIMVWTGFGWYFLFWVLGIISIIGLRFAWIKKDILPPILMGIGVAGLVLTILISGVYLKFF